MEKFIRKQIKDSLNHIEWTFAKTYAKFAPHEYFVDKQYPRSFRLFKMMIREYGVNKKFTLFGHTKTYRYLFFEGYKYWNIENILNREKLPQKIEQE